MTQTDAGLSLVFGEDLTSLVGHFSHFVYSAPGDVLSPAWSVVSTMSIRQWLDQELSRSDPTGKGGVSANLLSIFAKDLAVRIEQLALGEAWRDFGTETTALRILGSIELSSFDDARRRAEAIDDIVRWRPHLLEAANRSSIPDPVREAMEALNFFEDGAAAQRSKVLAKLRCGEVEGLPTQLAVFGLANVPGGERFMDLLEAIASQIPVRCFLPVPSLEMARAISDGRTDGGNEESLPFSWTRDASEALSLWLTPVSERTFLAPVDRPTSLLGSLQRRVLGDESATGSLDDESVRLLGGFGDSRQAEQLRDFLLGIIAKGVAPHEILVVSPKPAEFEQALERHWSYQHSEADSGPRLPNELIEVSPARLDNRLGVSLALLRIIGSYVTVEQVASLLTMSSVARTLGISFDDTQLIERRAKEGKLIFGISAEQRDRFDVYPSEGGSLPADIGTWERLSDAVAAATLYPPPADDEATRRQPVPGVGESGDLRLFGRLQPLLRVLEEADHLRPAGALGPSTERRTLAGWLDQLSSWMAQVAGSDGEDDSFERVVLRLERALASDPSLGQVTFDLEQLIELWASMAQARTFSRIFGRGGVVVAGLDALAFAPFRVVCILGLDEEKLPPSVLPSQIMGLLPADAPMGQRSHPGDPDPRRAVHGGLLAALLSARERLCISWNAVDEGTGAGIDPSIALAELLAELAGAANADGSMLAKSAASSARRHGFSGEHGSVRFDTRITKIVEDPPGRERALVELAPEVPIPLSTLRQFYRDPLGRHLRHAENVLVPQRLEESPTRPAIEVDNLTLHDLRATYVGQIMELDIWGGLLDRVQDEASYLEAFDELKTESDAVFDELCSSEEFVGDVPRIFWLKAELKAQLDLYAFNLAFDLADAELITSLTASELAPIDLGELGTISLVSAHGSRAARFEPRRMLDSSGVVVIQQRPKVGKSAREVQGRVFSQLVELLALRINNPGHDCRVLSIFAPDNAKIQGKNMTKESVPKGAYRLNPYLELSASPESLSADQARHQLEILVRTYWRGMGEILPLFAETTETLAFDGWSSKLNLHAKSSWEGGYMKSGDKDDIPSLLHFPLSWRQLRSREGVNQLTQSLRPAGRGVEFWWGSATSRPAPLTLRQRHAGFATKEELVRRGIADAAGDDEAAKFKRVTSALVWTDDA